MTKLLRLFVALGFVALFSGDDSVTKHYAGGGGGDVGVYVGVGVADAHTTCQSGRRAVSTGSSSSSQHGGYSCSGGHGTVSSGHQPSQSSGGGTNPGWISAGFAAATFLCNFVFPFC